MGSAPLCPLYTPYLLSGSGPPRHRLTFFCVFVRLISLVSIPPSSACLTPPSPPGSLSPSLPLSLSPSLAAADSDFPYRQCWGSDAAGHDWDKTQVFNNTIYVVPKHNAVVQCGKYTYPLQKFQENGNDPDTLQLNSMPPTADVVAWALSVLGTW